MNGWLRRKPISREENSSGKQLAKTLGWPHLVALGIGGVVGTGIFTLIGNGAGKAGPAVMLAFVIAGVVCACAALCYAELATMIPLAGGAYTYSYAALGETIAWIVGWSLILEYSLVVGTVAVSWSGYIVGVLNNIGIHLPEQITTGLLAVDPETGIHGIINLPAIFIVFLVAGVLMLGTKHSSTLNAVLVAVKIAALVLFVVVTLPFFQPANFDPFMPYGFVKNSDGKGVMAAAAIIFFAFYGFDTIATAAEETKNPKRDLSIGIVGSLAGCIIIYILVGLGAVGSVNYLLFAEDKKPLMKVLEILDFNGIGTIVGIAASIAMPTVLFAFLYGQTRVFFVMGRDGLLPRVLSKVHPKTGTPIVTTLVTACAISLFAGTMNVEELASLANSGTLVAFTSVCVCLLVLRKREPDIERKFHTPLAWFVAPVAIIGCVYLFFSLDKSTQLWFLIWNVVGFFVYLAYGRHRSRLAVAAT